MKLIDKIKWTGTAILIVAAALNGIGYWPAGPLLLALGGYIWLVAGIMQKDYAMITVNAIMSTVGIISVVYKFLS